MAAHHDDHLHCLHFSIIGLYLSFILLIGRALRMGTTGLTYDIMYKHLPYVDHLMALLMNIYLAREAQAWQLEEELYAKLVFLYRSPETMIKETRRPISTPD